MVNKLNYFMKDKKKFYTILISVIGVIVVFVIVFLVLFFMNRKATYANLETNLKSATEKYLKDHEEMIPTEENPELSIDDTTLETGKYIKNLKKSSKDNCVADVKISYQNEGIVIKPFLSCDNYETKVLLEKIKTDNAIISIGNGLYDLNEMLVFRGDAVNNYVKFNNLLWRIVKMNEDGAIYLVLANVKDSELSYWDDRYNTAEESNHGINDYNVSRSFDTLERIYTNKFSSVKSNLIPMNLCIGKRSEKEQNNNSSVECSSSLDNKYIGLLPLFDYINASTDHNCLSAENRGCANYNYLLTKDGKWWTLTADGSNGTKVYGINYSGVITSDYANTKKYLRYVIALDGTMVYNSGNGTKENPYMIR